MRNKYRNTDSSIKAGDLILTEQPFAFVLSSKEQGSRCDNCLEKGKVLKCSGCQFVYYCGRACQRDAWGDHKWECANFKRVAPKVLPDGARMLAKIINRLYRDYSDLKSDTKRMDHFTSLCVVLYEFLKDISLPNTVELMGLYGRMVINSFMILDIDMNSIGTGIYLASSILDHSCDPNAVAIFDGKTINIRAIKDMPCLDWNQYLFQNVLIADENQLKHVHGAICLNKQCNEPVTIPWKEDCLLVRRPEKTEVNEPSNSKAEKQEENSTDLNKIEENGVDEKDALHCKECGTKYTDKHVDVFVKTMEFTHLHLQNMERASVAYVDVCQYCLDRQEGVLHPLNVMHAQTLDHAFDALIQVQLWDKACVYAEKLIPCFRFYYGDRNPLLGLLHLKYGKILLFKMDVEKALAQLKCAEKIIKMTHGDRHPLYKEQLLPLLQQAIMES
ncbi:hypothetical protein HF086_014554 [Spodoptera exigua]|uniref:MYND-type domain-containing protein n=1 Tax=Spodoptera exigua TaxID=7107 RepID=A0A922M3W4_SPOEX|nr:hypothetical protein HF086_014554 [Spodoptera exigua]